MKTALNIFSKTLLRNMQVVRFGAVGVLGFMVDSALLYVSLYYFGFGYYLGRLISYLCATTVAWYFHRVFTFKVSSGAYKHKQLINFQVMNSAGGGINYAIYALLIENHELFRRWPVMAVGIGAVVGMFINYYLSKRIVFRA